MERKKILFVITKSNFGGAQRYCFDLATHLPKSEFEVKVVYGGTGEADAKRGALSINLQEKGIDGIFLQSFMRDVSFLKDARAFFELLTVFRRECPDIVHLNSSKAGGIGALAARFARVPKIIFTVHGWPFLERRNILSRAIILLASWFTALLCHKIIVVSEYDLKIARKMPFIAYRAVQIYNGIDLHMQFGPADVIRHSFPKGAHITGTIGELNRNKNQIALVEQAKSDPSMYV